MNVRTVSLGVLILTFAAAAGLGAEDAPGQAKLDKAIELKLGAESINELGEVIELCKGALKDGLDDENKGFAQQLLVSTLIQRGTVYADALLRGSAEQIQTLRQFRQLRAMALGDLDQAAEIDPNQPQAWFMIGRLESIAGGDHERALAAFNKTLELEKNDHLLQAKTLTARAGLLDDYDKQMADLNEAVKLAPDAVEVLRARGLLLAEKQKYDEAKADFEKAVSVDPADAMNYVTLAAVLAQQQKYDEAMPILDKAIELEPDASQLYNQRARIQLLRGKAPEALKDLDKTLELVPDQPLALLLRANALHQLGDRDRALADVERVLKEHDAFAPALRMRGLLLADSGKLKEAVDTLREAIAAAPDDAELRLQLAAMELASKDPEGAIRDFSSVIDADHDNWMALQGRADAYLALGKHKEALADYDSAMKLQPKSSQILNNLAWLLATSTFDELRDGKRAIELAKEACQVTDYKQAHILSTLAAAYAETGDFETAKEWSRKAVAAGADAQKAQLSKELKSYEEKKPWRELIAEPLPESDVKESQAQPEQKAEKTAARVDGQEEKR